MNDNSIPPASGCDRRAASLPCIDNMLVLPAIMSVLGASHRRFAAKNDSLDRLSGLARSRLAKRIAVHSRTQVPPFPKT
jgi:hypothetical protein